MLLFKVMYAKIIETKSGFSRLQHDWTRLQTIDPDVSYYSTFEFLHTWWQTFKKHKTLFIICVYHNNAVVGIMPLYFETRRHIGLFSCKECKFLASGLSDFFSVLIDKSINADNKIFNCMMSTIEKHHLKWDRLLLIQMDSQTAFSRYLLKHQTYAPLFSFHLENPYLNLSEYENFSAYCKKHVSKNMNWRINKLQRDEPFNFNVSTNNQSPLLDEIKQLHLATCRYRNKHLPSMAKKYISVFSNKTMNCFFNALYSNNCRVLNFTIRHQKTDELMAYNSCYIYNSTVYMWNTSYNVTYDSYHLGKIINYKIIEHCFDNDHVSVFDFGAGKYPWKFEWTDTFKPMYKLEKWTCVSLKNKLLPMLNKTKTFISTL
ncbi:MAG: GNAT family N-acetyltransferase [bacterium]